MKRYHFIAVGGAVMHQMAILLKKQGNIVSGSDDAIFDPAKSNLQKFGILPLELGWNVDIITTDLDCIILGMHARADNPELIKAKALNIPVYSFPEFIFKQSTDKKRLVVGGSHGKTTTTAMIIHALKAKKLQFDYLVGSKLDDLDFMVDLNPENKIIVIEGDEYLSSPIDLRSKFLHYKPHIAIITGIAWDHINVFPTFESYLATFKLFMESVSDTLILNKEDDELLNLEKKTDIKCPVIHYETLPFEINDGLTTIQFSNKNYNLKIFGKHNISNMASAMHACKAIGISENDFLESMQSFGGTAKRLEKIYELPEKKCTVYRDFAHAPSKVKATVAATRAQFPNRKLIAIFELHTFSSLQTDFLNEYKKSLEGADFASVYIDDEALALKRMERHTQTQLLEAFDYENLQILNHKEDILNFMNRMPMENCVYLLMSSGHLGGLNFVKWFSEKN